MLGLESAVLPAVGAGPVPPLQKLDPFDRRIRALGLELAGSSPRVDRLSDIAVFAAVLCEIRRELLPMPLVNTADWTRRASTGADHASGAWLHGLCPDSLGSTRGRTRDGDQSPCAALASCSRSATSRQEDAWGMERRGSFRPRPLLRGNDSNVRPSGYEPDELPLLHPAT